ADLDLFLHVRTGGLIVGHRAVIAADPYSFLSRGAAWPDGEWLSQVLFFLVFSRLGVNGLLALKTAVLISAFLLLSALGKVRTIAVPILLFLAITAVRWRLDVKPEMFGFLMIAAYLWILNREDRRGEWALPFLQCLWANLHGSFILGPILILFYILQKPDWKKFVILFLSSAACFINPFGYQLVLNPLVHEFFNRATTRIYEWQPPNLFPGILFDLPLQATALLLCASLFLVHRRFKAGAAVLPDLLCVLFALSIGLTARRHLPVAAIIFTASSIRGLAYFPAFRVTWKIKAAIILVFVAVLGYSCVSTANGQYYLRHEPAKHFGGGISDFFYPEAAADFVKDRSRPGNLYNDYDIGDYLIYRLWPEHQITIDGRNEVYGNDLSLIYERTLSDAAFFESFCRDNGIYTAVLSLYSTDASLLLRHLARDRRWHPVFLDHNAVVFSRDAGSAIDLEQRSRELLARTAEPALLFRLGDFFVRLGRDDIGYRFYQRGLRAYPDFAPALINAGVHLLRNGKNSKAEAYFERAAAADRFSATAYFYLGNVQDLKSNEGDAFWNYRMAYWLGERSAVLLNDLGVMEFARGDARGSVRLLEEATRRYPGFAEAYRNLGRSYLYGRGDTIKARRAWQTYWRMRPGDPDNGLMRMELEKHEREPRR
ncbi:MAG TPA: tetratricopeptide repeat protein, partial [Candidatus Omnitrophota bacterium]|nr:tetratricopeptide repeat protein [Candidatus Omnitrophota bacterium]